VYFQLNKIFGFTFDRIQSTILDEESIHYFIICCNV